MWQRFEIHLACWLLRGSGLCVMRDTDLYAVRDAVNALDEYTQRSGALLSRTDTRRLVAHFAVTRTVAEVRHHLRQAA